MQPGERRGGGGRVYAVKLGGSVATYKDKPFAPRLEVLERLAWELAEAVENGVALVGLVLGGGSYGHYAAAEARDANPGEALSLVTSAMLELALVVSDLLGAAGLRPVVYPPHSLCSPEGLRPRCRWEGPHGALALGALPVLYGDAYPCGASWCIVSGDELLVEMSCALGASEAVYVTDVDGVFVEGRLARRLSVEEAASAAEERRQGYDVTGGMARKMQVLGANQCPGLRRIWLVNGLAPGRLRGLLLGEEVVATEILL